MLVSKSAAPDGRPICKRFCRRRNVGFVAQLLRPAARRGPLRLMTTAECTVRPVPAEGCRRRGRSRQPIGAGGMPQNGVRLLIAAASVPSSR
jgi:hypothetical protein